MVAGHRRKFAAALAKLTEIPCIVRNLTDDEATSKHRLCDTTKAFVRENP